MSNYIYIDFKQDQLVIEINNACGKWCHGQKLTSVKEVIPVFLNEDRSVFWFHNFKSLEDVLKEKSIVHPTNVNIIKGVLEKLPDINCYRIK